MLTLGYLLRNASWFLSLVQFDLDTSSSILGPLKRVPLHSTLLLPFGTPKWRVPCQIPRRATLNASVAVNLRS
jgi:hypothetical protein